MAKLRLMMALIGALAGGSLYALGTLIDAQWLVGLPALASAVLAGVFFGGLLILTGPLPLHRAVLWAAGIALAVTGLFSLADLRFANPEDIAESGVAVISLGVLIWLPWPFVIAQADRASGWRDYPSLFLESWGIVVRISVALIFTGIVWLVVALSQALLGLVGVGVIDLVLKQDIAPWLITGLVLGLSMAVVNELADVLSPGLVLRLFRLLVPVVLVVMAVFLLALPLRGFSTIFGLVSSTAMLLAMVAVAVTLVTSALDQEDATAAHSGLMVQSTRALAAIVVLPAGLAAWTLGLRVTDHGWTPPRFLAASLTVLALGYGLAYLAAVLRGRNWMERIRQANIWLALTMMALSVLWLSVLNPESLSAASQIARISDGRTKVEAIDLNVFSQWGHAGQAALGRLREMAKTNAPLAARLTAAETAEATGIPVPADTKGAQAALAASLPLQPDTAATQALRAQILAGVSLYDLQAWQSACDARLPQGGPGCVLVVGDFLPETPGEEAMLIARNRDGYLVMQGFSFDGANLHWHSVTSYQGNLPGFDEGAALIDGLQKAPPPFAAMPLTQMKPAGGPGMVFAP